jgi:hypothetical protein
MAYGCRASSGELSISRGCGRESYGELIQIDSSDHRRFEQRGEPSTLLVFTLAFGRLLFHNTPVALLIRHRLRVSSIVLFICVLTILAFSSDRS